MPPPFSFEYCALHYLNQWINEDSNYCDALTSGTKQAKLGALNKAAASYKISRNLPLAGDIEKGLPRFKPLLDTIDRAKPSDFATDPVKGIRRFESAISKKYGGRGVLSLTTKVLWLKVKSPIIVYDARARKAIGTEVGDLASYYAEWETAFQKHSKRIKSACAELATMSKYTTHEKLATKKYIQNLTSNRWFKERVFDIYLWNIGDNE